MAELTSKRWAAVELTPEAEHAAATATRDFLERVRKALEEAGNRTDVILEVPFSDFTAQALQFLLAAIGTGEVRIVCGNTRAEETGIHGLWRVQEDGIDRFEVTRLPPFVKASLSQKMLALEGLQPPEGAFAAPAILQQLARAQQSTDLERVSFDPAYTIELSRQPLGPADDHFMSEVLGQGAIDIGISGFADANLQSTAMKGIWRSKIFNKAGKALFDAYVVATLPPEVANDSDEMAQGAAQCRDALAWINEDLDAGRL